ncbi:UNVERIFIED_CONTAM: putative E3 ubiquitin-protein ligase ARI2 [Sesamum angustifolium]|uniref:E3 ubiquitin-protein ligase ARI2 n=1 Tax=Sesamum angustifolium TaxID=2727405 RepID=A0AAW2L992_9LAMI
MEENSGHWSSDDDFYDRAYDDVECESQERHDESETSWSNAESVSCKVIRKESLLAAQKYDLQRMMELLSLKEHHARSVLIHYRWDVDKVSTVFVEKGKERLYAEAGVSVVDSNNLRSSCSFSKITCEICFEEFPANETTTMECGHCFCNEFRVENDEYCEVECVCGLQFCFSCSSEAHSPCSCLMWELWVRKCKDQSGSIDWITKNTRSCPKCHKLTRSRKILLHSYAFAYFMFGDELFKDEMSSQEKTIKQNLFEDQQQQLETNVERLSMFLEEQFAKYPKNRILELRTKVITLSAVTDKLCKKLYDCIENELLGPLQQVTHIIAPYRSKGVERASELPAKPEATKDEEGTNYEGH